MSSKVDYHNRLKSVESLLRRTNELAAELKAESGYTTAQALLKCASHELELARDVLKAKGE